jgi:uncharacterized protein
MNQPHRKIDANPEIKPWYRYGWVWFLIGIPATSVVVGIAYLWVSITMADSLVADDYYREGRAINQRLEKDEEGVRRGITLKSAITAINESQMQIRVAFDAPPSEPRPDFLRLRMSHPTIDHLDVTGTLMSRGTNQYEAVVPTIAPGRWHVQIEDQPSTWRVKTIWIVE